MSDLDLGSNGWIYNKMGWIRSTAITQAFSISTCSILVHDKN